MPGRHGGSLRVPGVCSACDAPTEDQCRLCLRPTCQDHMAEGSGTCVDCAEGRRS